VKKIFSVFTVVVCALVAFPAFSVSCPSSVFTTVQSRHDGEWAIHDLAPVDFDNDGKIDLVGVINPDGSSPGTLYAWKGNGDGTFQTPVSLGDTGVDYLAVTDVNHDGRKDIVMTKTIIDNNNYSYWLTVRLGNGTSFNAAQTSSIGFAGQFVMVLYDGDIYPDIVLADYGTIQIYHGAGDGTFTFLKQISLQVSTGYRVAAADFDGDGRLDLAYARYDTHFVDVIFQNADGSFTAPVTVQTGITPPSGYEDKTVALAVGDLDEDGHPDLIAANWEDTYSTASVAVLRYNGSRTFTRSTISPGYFHAPPNFLTVNVVDINGDGHLDILAGAVNGGIVMTSIGRGDGTFYSPSFYKPDPNTDVFSIAIDDFDNDGNRDLAVGSFKYIDIAKAACGSQTYLYTVSQVITQGQSAPLRAHVSGIGSDTPLPRGSVTFKDGATELTTVDLDGSGFAAVDANGLSVGSHSITAVFNGNAIQGTSTSQVVTQQVTTSATTTAIILPAGQSTYGSPYTINVSIKDQSDQTLYGYYDLDIDGVVAEHYNGGSLPLYLTAGSHTLTATYHGDYNQPPSTSAPVQVVTAKATPAISNSGALSVRLGTAHTLPVTVSGPNGVDGPTGTVQLLKGATLLTSGSLTNGVVTLSTTLPRGTTDVTAVYSGDSNYNSTSMALTLTVLPNQSVAIDARGLQNGISIRAVYPNDATSITLYRSPTGANSWSVVSGWTPALEYDTSVPSHGVLYDYKLTLMSSGSPVTSNIDTAMLFTSDPLTAGSSKIKRIDFDELRLMINVLRAQAGLSAFNFDATYGSSSIIRASHLSGLRTALDEARTILGMAAATYTDSAVAGTVIRAAHVQELRSLGQ